MILYISICIGFISGCDSEKVNSTKNNHKNISFDNIKNISPEELYSFFDVPDNSALVFRKLNMNGSEGDNYYIMLENNYINTINEASKLVYLFADEDEVVAKYFFQALPSANKNQGSEKIEIFSVLNEEPDFTIKYNIYTECFDLVIHKYSVEKNGFVKSDNCFKDCIGDELERISNSNWLRQARFLVSAPVEFAWIMAECAVDCLS